MLDKNKSAVPIDPKDVVLLSVPYCEPLPLVAPVLLAGCLESAGISARAIDFNALLLKHLHDNAHRSNFKNFLVMGHLIQPKFDRKFFRTVIGFTVRFIKQIRDQHNPKYIGLSIFTSESLDFGLIMSYLIRKHCPEACIIAGGKGLEVLGSNGHKHYETWINSGVADVIIQGDAETSIIDVIQNQKYGVVYSQPQSKKDLDNIPLAKWQDYDLTIYQYLSDIKDTKEKDLEPYMTVTASKGCVRRCTFCDVADFWPEFIYRDPVKVAMEIIHNYRATGIKKFMFTDNLINGSISNFRSMNQVLVDQIPNTITYRGYAIFRGRSQMPEEDFALAARAGNVRWSVGVESGSEKIRYAMKKKFDNQDLDWSVRMLDKYHIRQNWLLIVGYPTETEQDFLETKQLLSRYAELGRRGAVTIQITPTFTLLNNSPLVKNRDIARDHGLDHIAFTDSVTNKFWVSTKNTDNDYPTRSRRWKELVSLTRDLGYTFGEGMPYEKWWEEIVNLDRIYHEQKIKIYPVRRV